MTSSINVETLPVSVNQARRLEFELWSDLNGWSYRQSHINVGMRIAGALDVDALRASLDHVVREHRPLRTGFGLDKDASRAPVRSGAPKPSFFREIVCAPSGASCPIRFVSAADDMERAWDTHLHSRFVYTEPPLVNATLVRSPRAGEHDLLLNMSHLLADRWAMLVMTKELWARYSELTGGRARAWPSREKQYVTWARHQQEIDRRRQTWKRRHAPLDITTLAIAAPPSKPSVSADGISVALPREVAAAIRTVSVATTATPYVVTLTALHLVLHAMSGRARIGILCSYGNRTNPITAELLGCLAESFVCQARIDPQQTVEALCGQVRKSLWRSCAEIDSGVQSEDVDEDGDPQPQVRESQPRPWVPVPFVDFDFVHETPLPKVRDLQLERLDMPVLETECAIRLRFVGSRNDTWLRVIYAVEHVRRAGVDAMIAGVMTALTEMGGSPDRVVKDVSQAVQIAMAACEAGPR